MITVHWQTLNFGEVPTPLSLLLKTWISGSFKRQISKYYRVSSNSCNTSFLETKTLFLSKTKRIMFIPLNFFGWVTISFHWWLIPSLSLLSLSLSLSLSIHSLYLLSSWWGNVWRVCVCVCVCVCLCVWCGGRHIKEREREWVTHTHVLDIWYIFPWKNDSPFGLLVS